MRAHLRGGTVCCSWRDHTQGEWARLGLTALALYLHPAPTGLRVQQRLREWLNQEVYSLREEVRRANALYRSRLAASESSPVVSGGGRGAQDERLFSAVDYGWLALSLCETSTRPLQCAPPNATKETVALYLKGEAVITHLADTAIRHVARECLVAKHPRWSWLVGRC